MDSHTPALAAAWRGPLPRSPQHRPTGPAQGLSPPPPLLGSLGRAPWSRCMAPLQCPQLVTWLCTEPQEQRLPPGTRESGREFQCLAAGIVQDGTGLGEAETGSPGDLPLQGIRPPMQPGGKCWAGWDWVVG